MLTFVFHITSSSKLSFSSWAILSLRTTLVPSSVDSMRSRPLADTHVNFLNSKNNERFSISYEFNVVNPPNTAQAREDFALIIYITSYFNLAYESRIAVIFIQSSTLVEQNRPSLRINIPDLKLSLIAYPSFRCPSNAT